MFVWILWIAGENVMILEEVSWAMFEDSEEAIEAKWCLACFRSPAVPQSYYHPHSQQPIPPVCLNSMRDSRRRPALPCWEASAEASPGNDFSGRWGWMWWPLQTITASKTACCSLPLLWVRTSHCPEDAKSGRLFTLMTVVLNKHREGLINYSVRALEVRMGQV